jgi:FlaA1/EpsC-like NDP-sugar epimerase
LTCPVTLCILPEEVRVREGAPGASSSPGNRNVPRFSYVVGGLKQYAPAFAVEVALFWAALLAFQATDGTLRWRSIVVIGLPLTALAMATGEWSFRLYRRVWAVAGLPDALAIVAAVLEASAIVAAVNLLIPPSIQPYQPLLVLFAAPAVVGAVGLFRLFPNLRVHATHGASRLLVVAPGTWAYPTVKALIEQRSSGWSPVGIVTADGSLVHQTLMGVPIVGRADDLVHWLDVLHAEGVAFVSDENGWSDWRSLLKICLDAELPVFVLKSPKEWLTNGNGHLRQLTADDLVGRPESDLQIESSREFVQDRVVLVTGAAGSIGSEICRCLASLRPRRLILVDNNESGLFDVAEELRTRWILPLREALVSIDDTKQLIPLFAEERPDIVFHAAAYKHVPMLESHPIQAVATNVIGTWNVLRCAAAVGTAKFILISTDKAVAQHSIMGCSKRLCELIVLTHMGSTSAWGVRFGNVVGSRGSVVPLFERQIIQGGPVTITHPEATRYMMTKREAASLTIATLRMATANRLYMLNMGEPVQILRLAQALIRSRGLRPGADIEIIYTGLRPGEIVTEELLAPDEAWRATTHPEIREVISAVAPVDPLNVQWIVERLRTLAEEGRSDAVVSTLRRAMAIGKTSAIRSDEQNPEEASVTATTTGSLPG